MFLDKHFNKLFLVFLVVFAIVSVNIMGHDVNWDLANYHYYSVYALFHNRIGFDIMPCGIQSYLNPLLDIPFYILVKYLNNHVKIVMSLQSLYWAFAAFLVYLISKNIFVTNKQQLKYSEQKIFWIFSSLLGATSCIGLFELGGTYNDLSIVIMVLFSVLLFTKYLYTEDSRKRTILITSAGLILGMASGLKTSAVLFLTGTLISLICLCRTYQKPLKIILLFAFAAISGYFITNGFWMYILYSKFQNPFFPYYNDIFQSNHALNFNYMEHRYAPQNLKEFLLFPFSGKSFILPCLDYRQRVVYILFLVYLLRKLYDLKTGSDFLEKIKDYINLKAINFLIVFTIISYLLWISGSGVLRYFLPVIFLFGIFLSTFFVYLKTIIKSEKVIKCLTCIIFVLFIVSQKNCDTGYTRLFFTAEKKVLNFENLKIPDDSVVLELGVFPSAILIPFQNPKVKFIYLFGPKADTYTFSYSENKLKEIKQIIEESKDKVYLIYSDWEPYEVDWEFASEYIDKSKYECRPIKNNFAQKYMFCSPNKQN